MKNLLLSFCVFFISLNLTASHFIGGDFYIEWVGQNVYNIQLRLFGDNNAIPLSQYADINIYEVNTNTLVSTLTLSRISYNPVIIGDSCFTPDTNVINISEAIYIIDSVALVDLSGGYYFTYQTCCRAPSLINISSNLGISIFAIIPDPAFGQNSTPDFGDHHFDAYLCANNTKSFTYSVVESDGDSLVYSFVDPMDDGPPSGNYPYLASCTWQPGYSLLGICGGSPAMSVDSQTGQITASPSLHGFFAFALRIEEFRNGIKLGEVRREMQLASLLCTPPLDPDLPTISALDSAYLGDTVTMTIISGNLNDASHWQWYEDSCGGTPIGNGDSINVIINSAINSYFVRGEGACTTSPCSQHDIISQSMQSLLEVEKSNAIVNIFPNPFSSTTQISVENISYPYDIELLDITGRVINTWTNINSDVYTISVKNNTLGAYFVLVKTKEFIIPLKILIK